MRDIGERGRGLEDVGEGAPGVGVLAWVEEGERYG